ncbi:hypothetical protein F4680DRAFT_174935 [Xylaria scruposa]|nr:hypothetical protein F4680DRAFT_174935 [Xylaria scruposa]
MTVRNSLGMLSCCIPRRLPRAMFFFLVLLSPKVDRAPGPRSPITVKTFSNLLNSVHHPYAGARCSSRGGSAADSPFTS